MLLWDAVPGGVLGSEPRAPRVTLAHPTARGVLQLMKHLSGLENVFHRPCRSH